MKIRPLVIVLILGLISIDGFAQAAPLSGCEAFRDTASFSVSVWYIPGDYQFYAGETLFVSVTPPVVGSPTLVELIFGYATPGFSVMASTTVPGIMSYTFPANELVTNLGLQTFPFPDSVTVKFSCVKPATPVPTLNWQGIAALVTLLTGFAYYRRRKVV